MDSPGANFPEAVNSFGRKHFTGLDFHFNIKNFSQGWINILDEGNWLLPRMVPLRRDIVFSLQSVQPQDASGRLFDLEFNMDRVSSDYILWQQTKNF